MKLKTIYTAAAILSLGLAGATSATAKAHDQGLSEDDTTEPGTNVGQETVGPAQTLGYLLGNGKNPEETGAGTTRGNSANAGKPK